MPQLLYSMCVSIDRKGLSLNRIGMSGILGALDASSFLLHLAIMGSLLLIAKMVPYPYSNSHLS